MRLMPLRPAILQNQSEVVTKLQRAVLRVKRAVIRRHQNPLAPRRVLLVDHRATTRRRVEARPRDGAVRRSRLAKQRAPRNPLRAARNINPKRVLASQAAPAVPRVIRRPRNLLEAKILPVLLRVQQNPAARSLPALLRAQQNQGASLPEVSRNQANPGSLPRKQARQVVPRVAARHQRVPVRPRSLVSSEMFGVRVNRNVSLFE